MRSSEFQLTESIFFHLYAKGPFPARTSANDNVLGRFWSFRCWQLGHHHCHGLRQDPQSVSLGHKILVSRLSIGSFFSFRTFPINFVLLALFTAAESVLVGQVCGKTSKKSSTNSGKLNYLELWLQAAMMYDGEVVMIAMAATALLVIALTLFAFQVSQIHLISLYSPLT